jgi:hypothetical protein
MGCFDSSCVISGIPVHYKNKSAYLFLGWKNDEKYTSINDGPFQFYKPVFFPIKGNYDDYGRLENIEKDWNTAFIEQYFGISIESIFEYGERASDKEELERHLKHAVILRFIGKDVEESYHLNNRKDLESLGFIFSDEENFTHPHIEQCIIHYKEKKIVNISCSLRLKEDKVHIKVSIKFTEKQKKQKYNFYEEFEIDQETDDFSSLNYMYRRIINGGRSNPYTERWLSMTEEQTEKYIMLACLQMTYVDGEVYDAVQNKGIRDSHWTKQRTKDLTETVKLSRAALLLRGSKGETDRDKMFAAREHGRSYCNRLSIHHFDETYYMYAIENDENLERVTDALDQFDKVYGALHTMNRYFMPTRSFEQYGDVGEQRTYQTMFNKIMRNRNRRE